MKIEIDDVNHTALIEFTSGATVEFKKWSRHGDTSYLSDGEIDERPDGCIFARLGNEEVRIEPASSRPPRKRRRAG